MKQSRAFIPIAHELPAEVRAKSHQLLLRAGFLRQHANGIYSYLPFGLKVLRKIEAVIHEEMAAIDAEEMLMPTLQKAELYEKQLSHNLAHDSFFYLEDREQHKYVLGALHRELMTSLVKEEVKSYQQLPLTVYQLFTNFLDKQCPRTGLIDNRESMMKEAYSFHQSEESLEEKYAQLKQAYINIFTRLELQFYEIPMELSENPTAHQFIVQDEEGGETIAVSTSGSFAAHIEHSPANTEYEKPEERVKEIEKVHTVNLLTVEEITAELEMETDKYIKTVVYYVQGEPTIVLIRGDYKISETKLKQALGTNEIMKASPEEVESLLSTHPNSIGPVKLPVGIKVAADYSISSVVNGVTGANENDSHFINVNPEKDFAVNQYADIRYIEEGDLAPDGNGEIRFTKGLEIGSTVALGTACSKAEQAYFQDESGELRPFWMGQYGMHLSRILTAIAEQYHDEFGLKWPKNLAPYDIHLVMVDLNDARQQEIANTLYKLLQSYRFGVLLDDRLLDEDIKFAEADLIGLPICITIGEKAKDGILEVKFRATGEKAEWQVEEMTEKLQAYFALH